MKKYHDIFKTYMEKHDITTRNDFLEEFIEQEVESIWDAYMSVLISPKQGNETAPASLKKRLSETTQYLALEEFFADPGNCEVYLTDEMISLNEAHDFFTVLHAIIGRKATIHLRVNPSDVLAFEKCLKQVAEEEASEIYALIKWKYIDDGYLIQLEKRHDRDEHIMRIYPDGKGVVVSLLQESYKISYFCIPDGFISRLSELHNQRTQRIIQAPVGYTEDDRYRGFSVVLWYGLMCIDEFAYDKLSEGTHYDLQEYSEDECTFSIMRFVFTDEEVKQVWKKHLEYNSNVLPQK